MKPITPCLWFATEAEDAANFYVSIFKDGKILSVTRFTETGKEIHGRPVGSAMSVEFRINGQTFLGLNGGPAKFNQSISFQVFCENQAEVDHYWDRLTEGADPAAQQCGWLNDKFGLTWQVVPTRLLELMFDKDPARAKRATEAMYPMKKLDIAALERAADGTA